MILYLIIMSFPISSIEKKFCKSTKINVLNEIDVCINCQQVPLPPFRTTKHLDNIYCKKCFDLKNFDPKTHVKPLKNDIELLEKLVISCRFLEKGCDSEFQINSLESLILHEKKCLFNNSTLKLKDTL